MRGKMNELKQQDLLKPIDKPGRANGHGNNGNGGGGPQFGAPAAPPGAPASRPLTPEEVVDSLRFMFAVGIECSNPVIAGNVRVDELEATGHYDNWRKDLRL